MQSILKINSPRVIFERFDDETIVVDTYSSSYYSLTKTGEDIWHLIALSINSTLALMSISEKYNASSTEIKNAYEDFINYLVAENLVIEVPFELENLSQKPAPSESPITLQKQPFSTPQIKKYEDMQLFTYPRRLDLILRFYRNKILAAYDILLSKSPSL